MFVGDVLGGTSGGLGFDAVSSYFGSKSEKAAAKAQVEIARTRALQATRRAKSSEETKRQVSSTRASWLPVAFGAAALVAVGIGVLVVAARKNRSRA